MSKTFNKNIPYTFSGAINLSTSAGLNITNNYNTIGSIITTGGNVGIGTTAPQSFSQLHIRSSNSNSGSYIALDATNGANGRLYAIGSTLSGNTANAGALEFFDLTSSVMRMIIGSTGNVGIGITAPSSRLHVVMGDATSAGSAALWDSTYSVFGQSSNTGGAVGIGYNSASGGCLVSLSPNVAWQPMTYRGANHRFVISGTVNTPPSMILNSSGNLGIGTTSPGTILDIVSSTPIITIRESTNASGKIYFGNSSHGVGRNASIGALTNGNDVTLWTNGVGGSVGFATQLTERMRITDGGSVGIGTSSPQATLHVGTGQLQLGASNTAGVHMLASNSGLAVWRGTWGAGIAAFCSDSRGNFGIGTHTPAYALDVTGSLRSTGDIFIGNGTTAEAINLWDIPGAAWQLSTGSYNLSIRNGTAGSTMVDRVTITSTGNVGIGTTTPLNRLHVVGLTTNTGGVIAEFRNSSNGERIQIIDETTTGLPPGICSPLAGFGMGIYGRAGNIRFLTTSSNLERMTITSTGNVGIGTTSPAFTLDVNGTIARSGVKLPRYDNGSFSGAASFSIPILFNDTQYNYAEFRVRYVTSNVCNINISATSYVNAAMTLSECALTTVRWNSQNTPLYATFSGVTSGMFADTVEAVGLDNNLIFRIVRATGTSTAGIRNHYSYDNIYCFSGVGTARGYGQGHIDCASVGGSPLQFVTFTCSTGTISGTYSSVHYY